MNLHEYQAKALFAEYGIPVPKGQVATTPFEAKTAATALGGHLSSSSGTLPPPCVLASDEDPADQASPGRQGGSRGLS